MKSGLRKTVEIRPNGARSAAPLCFLKQKT
jgi:hypothetical protein